MNQRITANLEFAQIYGIDEAHMIEYLRSWIQFNKRLGKNQVDGRTWTYDSLERIAERSRLWTIKQVRRILSSLRKQGVLVVGHHSKWWCDRTNWYAFADEVRFLGSELAGAAKKAAGKEPEPDAGFERFVDQVAEAYNELLVARNLSAEPKNRRFRHCCDRLRKERPGVTLAEIRAAIEQLLKEVNRKPDKASLLKWKSLLHPNTLGSILDRLANAPPREGPEEAEEAEPDEPKRAPLAFVQKLSALYAESFPEQPAPDPEDEAFGQLCDELMKGSLGSYELRLNMMAEGLAEAKRWTWKEGDLHWQVLLQPYRIERLVDSALEQMQAEEAEKRAFNPPAGEGVVIEGKVEPPEEAEEAKRRFEEQRDRLLDSFPKNEPKGS